MKASLQTKPMYCSRDYYYSSRFNQQYEKPTPISRTSFRKRVDVCAVTETWLKQTDINSMAHREVPPQGYNIISHSRPDDRPGGGVAIVYRDNVKVKDHTETNLFSIMEYMNASICLNISTINLYIIYRYPASRVIDFCNELTSLLEENVNTDRGTLILTGDFNIHMDNSTHPDTNTFIDTLDGLDLRNHVNFLTHKLNHHLDLFIDTISSPILSGVECGFKCFRITTLYMFL